VIQIDLFERRGPRAQLESSSRGKVHLPDDEAILLVHVDHVDAAGVLLQGAECREIRAEGIEEQEPIRAAVSDEE
jgi:hypothetical protein